MDKEMDNSHNYRWKSQDDNSRLASGGDIWKDPELSPNGALQQLTEDSLQISDSPQHSPEGRSNRFSFSVSSDAFFDLTPSTRQARGSLQPLAINLHGIRKEVDSDSGGDLELSSPFPNQLSSSRTNMDFDFHSPPKTQMRFSNAKQFQTQSLLGHGDPWHKSASLGSGSAMLPARESVLRAHALDPVDVSAVMVESPTRILSESYPVTEMEAIRAAPFGREEEQPKSIGDDNYERVNMSVNDSQKRYIETLSHERDYYEDQVKDMAEEVTRVNEQLLEVEALYGSARNQVHALESRIRSLEDSNIELENQVDELMTSGNDQMNSEVAKLKESMNLKNSEVAKLKESMNLKNGVLNEKDHEIQEKDLRIEQLEEELADRCQDLEELAEKTNSLKDKDEMKNKKLLAQITHLESDLENYREKLEHENIRLQEGLAVSLNKEETLKNTIECLRTQLSSAEEKLSMGVSHTDNLAHETEMIELQAKMLKQQRLSEEKFEEFRLKAKEEKAAIKAALQTELEEKVATIRSKYQQRSKKERTRERRSTDYSGFQDAGRPQPVSPVSPDGDVAAIDNLTPRPSREPWHCTDNASPRPNNVYSVKQQARSITPSKRTLCDSMQMPNLHYSQTVHPELFYSNPIHGDLYPPPTNQFQSTLINHSRIPHEYYNQQWPLFQNRLPMYQHQELNEATKSPIVPSLIGNREVDRLQPVYSHGHDPRLVYHQKGSLSARAANQTENYYAP
eukprot:GHVH01007407.1.p1 GENE.GHVH01007407.1~~GHVH01007407.1.p1  ORF type:complete len:737 (+),score=129.04 GHVH01007407.1:111-2321(+)